VKVLRRTPTPPGEFNVRWLLGTETLRSVGDRDGGLRSQVKKKTKLTQKSILTRETGKAKGNGMLEPAVATKGDKNGGGGERVRKEENAEKEGKALLRRNGDTWKERGRSDPNGR